MRGPLQVFLLMARTSAGGDGGSKGVPGRGSGRSKGHVTGNKGNPIGIERGEFV